MGEQLLFFLVLCFFIPKKNIFPPYFLRNHTFAFISKKKKDKIEICWRDVLLYAKQLQAVRHQGPYGDEYLC